MHPKTFFKSANLKPENGRCFVIMPFDKKFNATYETIREAVEDSSLDFICKRADNIQGGGNVMQNVLEDIGRSEIVIADLSEHNANVFYELGVAHMVKEVEKVIILIERAETVPFDLTSFRHMKYRRGPKGAEQLKAGLISTIKSITQRAFKFKVEQRRGYKFPQKLSGVGGYLYDFRIPSGYFGVNGAEIELRVMRYEAGGRGEEVLADKYGLGRGERMQLPKTDYDLRLEDSLEGMGIFRLFRR
jgi:hypothetical protein